jgi:hypothetical protein
MINLPCSGPPSRTLLTGILSNGLSVWRLVSFVATGLRFFLLLSFRGTALILPDPPVKASVSLIAIGLYLNPSQRTRAERSSGEGELACQPAYESQNKCCSKRGVSSFCSELYRPPSSILRLVFRRYDEYHRFRS